MLALRSYLNAVRWLTQEKDTIAALVQLAESDQASDDHREQASEWLKQLEWPAGLRSPQAWH